MRVLVEIRYICQEKFKDYGYSYTRNGLDRAGGGDGV